MNSFVQDSVMAENDHLKTELFAKMKALEAQRKENNRLEKEVTFYLSCFTGFIRLVLLILA
jgi:hypothetical protein